MSELEPIVKRLSASGADAASVSRLLRGMDSRIETLAPRANLQAADERVRRPRYLVSGWAVRYAQLLDGRRQIYDVILPGEGINVCLRPRPLAMSDVAALTKVEVVEADVLLRPEVLAADTKLADAIETAADLDEWRLLDQVVRLGRMSAQERLSDLLLQLHDRLAVIGEVAHGRFSFPLTQEVLADILGLSTVHVNRSLQELRRRNLVIAGRGFVQLPDPTALAGLLPNGAGPAAIALKSTPQW